MRIVQNSKLQNFVEDHLYADHAPRAIEGRLSKHDRHLPYASKDTIYRYIKSPYGRRVEAYRMRKRIKRRKPRPTTKPWKDRVFIDQRPSKINLRKEVGHCEGDFIVSGKSGRGILLVVVDRKLRVSFLEQILKPSVDAVSRASQRIKRRYPEWKTMTTDNDILFQNHQALAQMLGIKIYFCHPYHSWEKGSVENTNKYIRRDMPKHSDISHYSKRFIRRLEIKLNNRPMAVLKYYTPEEMLNRYRKRKKRLRAVEKY